MKRRPKFRETPEGVKAYKDLEDIALSDKFHSKTTYTANSDKYPDHRLPFVEKHMQYLETHHQVDVEKYIANLRLMSRK